MTRLEPRTDGVPVPNPSAESLPYWEGTRAGELRFQRCASCGTANFGPGLACNRCRSEALEWHESTGLGAVYSWTVVWRPQTPAFDVPYAPAIIRMDDGYDMMSALVGMQAEDITPGLRVRVEFHELDATITLPFFSPATDQPEPAP